MLEIKIPARSYYDEIAEEFVDFDEIDLKLEHSLISLDKWESEFEVPFLETKLDRPKLLYYIKCMSIKPIEDSVLETLPSDVINQIIVYIDKPMTATTINDSGGSNKEILTSEVIYYMMIKLGIPFECQKWHLNKLITLIRVCSVKDAPQKKMSKKDVMAQNRALNEARRKKYKTKG